MAKQANNNTDTEVTLTTTADVQATEPKTLLGHMEGMISEAEAAGDYTRAGILQNLAVRMGELKMHANVVADLLDGDAAMLVSQLRDGL